MQKILAAAIAATVSSCALGQVVTIDFDTDGLGAPLPAGTIVGAQWANLGVNFSAINSNTDTLVIFDSANPTGNDSDLVTPGYGPNNNTALGNILIIAGDVVDSDGDGLIDDPDDDASRPAGTIIIDLDFFSVGGSMDFLDIEEQTGTIELVDTSSMGSVVLGMPTTGDNGFASLAFPADAVFNQIRVNMPGSGAITAFTVTPAPGSAALIGLAGLLAARRRR